jgi:hypothetical protein
MLRYATSISRTCRSFTIASVHLIVLMGIVLSLAGCSDSSQGGPIISSLSTPSIPDLAATGTEEQGDPAEPIPSETDGSNPVAGLPRSNEEEDQVISLTATPTGATARLTWEASTDPKVVGYTVYYGKQSSGEHGSCSYGESQAIEAPPVTITGLDPNTPYFFAISAYGGEVESPEESLCSNEVLLVTPPAQS